MLYSGVYGIIFSFIFCRRWPPSFPRLLGLWRAGLLGLCLLVLVVGGLLLCIDIPQFSMPPGFLF
jgi:hypothetical protein